VTWCHRQDSRMPMRLAHSLTRDWMAWSSKLIRCHGNVCARSLRRQLVMAVGHVAVAIITVREDESHADRERT